MEAFMDRSATVLQRPLLPAAQCDPSTLSSLSSSSSGLKRLRPILPKPTSQGTLDASILYQAMPSGSEEFSNTKRSLAQKRRRERETRENFKPTESSESRSRRSIGQRARRQRELAEKIEAGLRLNTVVTDQHEMRSEAQRFRRQIEAAERRLQANPNCGSVAEGLGDTYIFNKNFIEDDMYNKPTGGEIKQRAANDTFNENWLISNHGHGN
ncbi:hypothetical protein R3P38DRAFT_2803851 [Favolaschia claudopus]|uniref:Uncharacterized protein n=1 Tax=Favolaschia claudopus TaxID=2862362 RepID=A0AAV9ZS37_9AGAR